MAHYAHKRAIQELKLRKMHDNIVLEQLSRLSRLSLALWSNFHQTSCHEGIDKTHSTVQSHYSWIQSYPQPMFFQTNLDLCRAKIPFILLSLRAHLGSLHNGFQVLQPMEILLFPTTLLQLTQELSQDTLSVFNDVDQVFFCH